MPDVDPVTGDPISDRIICVRQLDGTCVYYAYLQGTSMASPHATGVAAVIISEFGKRDRKLGGLKLNPEQDRADPQEERAGARLPRGRGTPTGGDSDD